MNQRISARWHVIISSLCYLVGAPLAVHFISPIGLGGLFFAYPLYTITWLLGKKRGLVAAGIGVVLNAVIWLVAGSGRQVMFRFGTTYAAFLLLFEYVSYAVCVFIVSNMRRREDQSREEIKLSRDLLYASEIQYRNLIEAAPLPIFIVKNGNLVFFNNLVPEMLGYSREELMEMPIQSILHAEDFESAWQLYTARSEGRLLPKSTLRILTKNRKTLWVETIGHRIEWEGRPAVLFFSSDISERKRAVDALRESEEKFRRAESKYRNLIEVAPEAISVVEKGKVIFFNSHLPEIFGYSPQEMQGISLKALLSDEDLADAMMIYASRAEGGVAAKSIFRYLSKQGKVLWVETVGQRIEWEGRSAVLYFSSDVTERKNLEQQFAQAQKMEAVGQLTGGVAHDFNNIIQVITGYGEILLNERLSEENHLLLLEMTKAARKAADLTQQLLSFSRKQVLRLRAVDAKSFIRSAQTMLERVVGEKVELRTLIDSTTGNFLADPSQIERILMNLAINARDVMPSGGELTIETSNCTFDEAYLRDHPGAKKGHYVRIAVSDTGSGMGQETLSHIYEPFFTTKARGKGTGLGLSTVYGIVKQSEGYISCHSELGKGTTFAIYLPLTLKEADPPLGAPQGTSAAKGTEQLLLVDDDPSVRTMAKIILEKAGYIVTEASSAEDVLSEAAVYCSSIKLLVTDVVLPRMNGKELACTLQKLSPNLKVLYVSGYTSDVLSHNGALEQDVNFIQKPFDSSELLTKVREILDNP
jgi:PAS domain S-box-containing protein